MRLGMIVRADFGRGLAHQTHSFYVALQPDVTVAIDNRSIDPNADPDNENAAWPLDFSRYPDAIISTWRGYTAELSTEALEALASCDVVYTAETHYDERLPSLVATVLHVNPEFWRHQPAAQYWYPTTWRLDDLPPGEVVPTPINDDDIAEAIPGPGKVLHVAGHYALGDRNGTKVITQMMRDEHAVPWRLASQDGIRLHPRAMQSTELVMRSTDRWAMYEGCAMMVLPRKYGGQSLQVNEAMARGLAVIMPDCEPNIDTWPVIPVPARLGPWVRTPGGRMRTHLMLTSPLRKAILSLLTDPIKLAHWQGEALSWARDHSWSEWRPKIQALLAEGATIGKGIR